VFNLWQILNPHNNNFVDNALLYDVLLLLIYNVRAAIPVTAGFLHEYLENHYQEEQIDIESFVNYNSGSSLGFSANGDDEWQNSNLNKYLAFNNLWSIERVSIEFKQIHANKVSYTQTVR
jgi:hypothetical protein